MRIQYRSGQKALEEFRRGLNCSRAHLLLTVQMRRRISIDTSYRFCMQKRYYLIMHIGTLVFMLPHRLVKNCEVTIIKNDIVPHQRYLTPQRLCTQRVCRVFSLYKLFRISAPLIDNFPPFKIKKAYSNEKRTQGHLKVVKNL